MENRELNNEELKKVVGGAEEEEMVRVVCIDPSMCFGCGSCYDYCSHGAIHFNGDTYYVDSSECLWPNCTKCDDFPICPTSALDIRWQKKN